MFVLYHAFHSSWLLLVISDMNYIGARPETPEELHEHKRTLPSKGTVLDQLKQLNSTSTLSAGVDVPDTNSLVGKKPPGYFETLRTQHEERRSMEVFFFCVFTCVSSLVSLGSTSDIYFLRPLMLHLKPLPL